MKKYLLLALLVAPFISFSQIDKIGYTKTQVINSTNGDPCKSSYNEIWYCGENGSLINYTFKNNLVSSVLYMWEFNSKYEADQDVRNEIAKAKVDYGRPEMKGDQAFWFTGNYLIMISYGFTNGKHYSCWRVSER
jgi:hypothetical protein